jgi:hypothetical protein
MPKRARKQRVEYTQKAMVGEETDGLEFLEGPEKQDLEHSSRK